MTTVYGQDVSHLEFYREEFDLPSELIWKIVNEDEETVDEQDA